MQKFIAWIATHARTVVALSGLLSVLALAALIDPATHGLRLQIDPSIERLLPAANADRALYEQLRRNLGDSDAVIVPVQIDHLFNPSGMQPVQTLHHRYSRLPGFRGAISQIGNPSGWRKVCN